MKTPFALPIMSGIQTLLFTLMLCQAASAGKLDEFEKDVTSDSEKNNSEHTTRRNSSRGKVDDDNDLFFDLFYDIFVDTVWQAGQASYVKTTNMGMDEKLIVSDGYNVKAKFIGEKIVPLVRIDVSTGKAESDVDLEGFRIELGYGPIAIHHKRTTFSEHNPKDKLELRQSFLSYRMTLSDEFELDVGIGEYGVEGNDTNTQGAISFSGIWSGNSGFGLEYRFVNVRGDLIKLNDHE